LENREVFVPHLYLTSRVSR